MQIATSFEKKSRGAAPFALLSVVVLVLLAPTHAQAQFGDPIPMSCAVIPAVADRYFDQHAVWKESTDELDARLVEILLKRLDPTHTLLSQKERDDAEAHLKTLVADIKDGKCDELDWVETKRAEWNEEMKAYAIKALDAGMEVDPTVEIVLDPEKRPVPKDEAALKTARDRQLQLQLALYLSSGLKIEEAREKLKARYERLDKQFDERAEGDRYIDFLHAFAEALDPHSSYFSADDLEDFRISMDLSLEGIGAVLRSEDGFTVVEEVIAGGAASKQGELTRGDKIVAVRQDDEDEAVSTIDMPLRDVVKMIRGKKDTNVHLTLLRKSGDGNEKLVIRITRDKVALEEQAAKLTWVDKKVGDKTLKLAVLDLPSFYGGQSADASNSIDDVKALIKEANEKGADGMLLDLSRNGGGLLNAAVEISGFFLAEAPIVGVAPADGANLEALDDPDSGILFSKPLVVLTSRASASASEITAGALQDYERAVIVGDSKTFGKGTVQNVVGLPPGLGAVKVTTLLFFLPDGKSTQLGGVKADVVIPSVLDIDDIGEQTRPYALAAATTKVFEGEKANLEKGGFTAVTDKQLKKLAKASAKRVAASKEFDEVLTKLKEFNEAEETMTLAEIVENRKNEDAEKEKNESGEKKEEGEKPDGAKNDEVKKDGAKKDGAEKDAANPKDGEKNSGDEKSGASGDKEEDPDKSPQRDEALNVLADLIELHGK